MKKTGFPHNMVGKNLAKKFWGKILEIWLGKNSRRNILGKFKKNILQKSFGKNILSKIILKYSL